MKNNLDIYNILIISVKNITVLSIPSFFAKYALPKHERAMKMKLSFHGLPSLTLSFRTFPSDANSGSDKPPSDHIANALGPSSVIYGTGHTKY